MPKAKAKKKSPEERALARRQRSHLAIVRNALQNMGFVRFPDISDIAITFKGTTSDFDDLFIWENVLLLLEYTVSSNNISEHVKKKEFLYSKIRSDKDGFFGYLTDKFPLVKESINKIYDTSKIIIKFVYCSRNDVQQSLKDELPDVLFYDYPIAMYFKALASSLKLSARPELLAFLKLGYNQVGENCLTSSGAVEDPFRGSILPESHSHIGHGFSIVSFYTSPAALLDRAYVLRKEGWRDSDWLYQRLISQKKIESIRQFVKARQRVFLNNMIVTLPNETRVLNAEDIQIDPSKVSSTSPVTIYLPRKINSVGVIDGQHRIFSYHEGGKFDEEIKPLRSKLNILVTGIIYPKNFSDQDRVKFESEIFLEINSNQVSAAPELKQAILSIISPFLAESIAKRVITRLNKVGPLRDLFIKYFYDKERLKTTSIVSYGLRHLVNIDNPAGLHCQWTVSSTQKLKEKQDLSVVDLYVDFCVERLNSYFGAVRQAVGGEKWVVAQKDQPGILNTTTINGLINLLRAMIERGQKVGSSDMSPIKNFKFRDYKSSQYGAMGKDLYDLLFPNAPES